jgi:histone deacetylase complex subunit SAP18
MDVDGQWNNIKAAQIKLPEPGEDATPCVIRYYVSRSTSFRPLDEFELNYRPLHEEFRLYVWRTITLREIATLLYLRDSTFNPSPFSLHAFRIVRFDDRNGYFFTEEPYYDIARISSNQIYAAKKDVQQLLFDKDTTKASKNTSNAFEKVMQDLTPQLPEEADEEVAKETLESIGWKDGDILDCILYESSNEPGRRRHQKQERSSFENHRSRRNR